MKENILSALSADNPWREQIIWFDTITSTNDVLKQQALAGAPHGTVLIADHQTSGRGRLGRSFLSPSHTGIYMSVLLRPECMPGELMHLTCAAAVAACDAIENTAGLRPGIKWTNDIVYQKRKLAGILTELGLGQSGTLNYAIIGIGVNCCQKAEDFPPELRDIAGSLAMSAQKQIDRSVLAAAMIDSFANMSRDLLRRKAEILEQYRQDCITLGQQISVICGDEIRHGKALDIDDEGALIVAFSDGKTETVNSGEVSVRGLYNYI